MKKVLQKVFSIGSVLVVSAMTLYILQGAFYRFSEPYALARLQLAWEGQDGLGKWLRFLPLDHFRNPPDAQKSIHDPKELLRLEDNYAKEILKFTRPSRDEYRRFLDQPSESAGQLLIKDLGLVKNVVLPNLSRPASFEDVQKGYAKKFGTLYRHSYGMVLFLTPRSNLQEYYQKFQQFEKTFAFLSQRGLACILLQVTSKEELLGQVDHLKINHGEFCEHIFACAEGDLASLLMEASFSRPYSFSAIVTKDLQTAVPEPLVGGSTWFLGLVTDRGHTTPKYRSLLKWCWSGRSSIYHYPSRLGGLLRYTSENKSLADSEFVISYILTAADYASHPEGGLNQSVLPDNLDPNTSVEIEQKQLVLEEGNEVEVIAESLPIKEGEAYSCDIVDQYRLMHPDDPLLSQISNRDLIIKLGKSFKSMGDEVLWQISQKDPLFFEYYQSLTEDK